MVRAINGMPTNYTLHGQTISLSTVYFFTQCYGSSFTRTTNQCNFFWCVWWFSPVKAGWITGMHSWRRHQTETFSALLALCAGNSTVTAEFPAQRQVTRSFDIFFHLCLNKRLNKQSWDWWFETPSRSLWRHCNASQCWQSDRKKANIVFVLLRNISVSKGLTKNLVNDCYSRQCTW